MKIDISSSTSFTPCHGFTGHIQPWKGGRRNETTNNNDYCSTMEDEISTDEDEPIKHFRIANREFVQKYKNSYLLNNDFDSGALRTRNDDSVTGVDGMTVNHAILRSLSLNTALDDVEEMCQVCNYREKMGRNRRRPKKENRRTLQKNEAIIIFYLGLIDFIGFCSMSVMAPFFPKEAEKKNMDVSHAGYVFSFYALVMFLTAPLFGKMIPYVGTKFMFISGIFLNAGCNILFGMLPRIQNNTQFAIFCFVVRGFEAVGAGAFSTASFIYVIHMFPDNVSAVLGVMETFAGLGMSIGPAFGGFLYAFGGFSLPFFVLGTVMLFLIPVYFYSLPPLASNRPTRQPGSFFKLVKIPSLLVIFLVVVISSNAWSFLDPTLEPHLRELNLTSQETGFVFLIFSAFYGVFCPIWGFVGDKCNNHWSMMAIGLSGIAISLCFLGPLPILNLQSTLLLNVGSLCSLAIFVSLSLAPTFKALLESSVAKGYPDSITTYSTIAGIWSCGYSLGDMTGPTLGGILLEYFSYTTCVNTMALIALTMAIICVSYFCFIGNGSTKSERPVLHPRLIKDKIAYYGALSNSSDRVNIMVTNSGACEV